MKRFLRKVRCAILLLKYSGWKDFASQIKRQIYSHHVQVGVEKYLADANARPVTSKTKYNFGLGSGKDMDEAFRQIATESKESVQQLLNREWLYRSGFGKWYVARSFDTGELCFIQGVIGPEDNNLLDDGFKGWFPRLKEDEILLEGAYAFEKYRGGGLCHAVASEINDIYRKKGFTRTIAYIRKDNTSSIKASEKTGFRQFEEIPVTKILFLTIHHKRRPAEVKLEALHAEVK
jgi:hypothetical protein